MPETRRAPGPVGGHGRGDAPDVSVLTRGGDPRRAPYSAPDMPAVPRKTAPCPPDREKPRRHCGREPRRGARRSWARGGRSKAFSRAPPLSSGLEWPCPATRRSTWPLNAAGLGLRQPRIHRHAQHGRMAALRRIFAAPGERRR